MVLPLHGDLSDSAFVAELAAKLSKLQMKVSLVDASNLADPHYLRGEGVYNLVQNLQPVLHKRAVLLTVVHEVPRYPSDGPSDWKYFSWTINSLRDARGRDLFLKGFAPQEVSLDPFESAILAPWQQIESAHYRFINLDSSVWSRCSNVLTAIGARLGLRAKVR